MGIWSKLLGYEDKKEPPVIQPPKFHNENIPDAFDLGLYYSEGKNEIQVAKVSDKDRSTHLYVVGATGTGKTKFLESLIRQDIKNGNGFCVIDPHGDLVEDIKSFLACRYLNEPEVLEKVILIDPTDPKYSVAFNPLEPLPGVSVAEQAEELLSAFRKIWSDSWGARMEDLMRNSLIALGETGLTLCELTPFLTRRSFREVVLEGTDNPTTKEYFRRFDSLTDKGQITWIEPVMNKIDAFLADERMRQIFSSPQSTFGLREAMDGKKHMLIKLDKGKLKGSSDLLGSLFMAKIQMAAFSRSNLGKHQRIPFYLYIDEFQNFATESFKVMLSEARKYGLSLIMAHQSLSQISDDLRSLILGSAGIQVYFRVNRQDAQTLAKEAFQYSGNWEREIEELQHLPPRMCYVKHKIQGGIKRLYTQKVEAASEMPGVSEEKHSNLSPLGMKYLLPREEFIAETRHRQELIEQAAKAKAPAVPENATPMLPEAVSESIPTENTDREPKPDKRLRQSRNKTIPVPTGIELPDVSLVSGVNDVKVEREHRRLQNLIKLAAEKNGYKAVIEEPTPDKEGRVDVGLERDGKRVACEVSVTTTPEHELANIEKCLAAGYDPVILCSPDKRLLEKVKALVSLDIAKSDQSKILFLLPEELLFMFDEEAAGEAGSEYRVKGYKVKINYQPVQETEKKNKRQAIAKVFLQSFRRDKQE